MYNRNTLKMIKIVLLALIGIVGVSCKTATEEESKETVKDSTVVVKDSTKQTETDTTKDGAGSFKTLPDTIK